MDGKSPTKTGSRFAARTARRDPGGVRVTVRDRLLLHLVARCRAVQTPQVGRALSMSPTVARRRCRALKDMGLLTCDVISADQPNWYRITARARPELVRTFGGEPEDWVVPRGLPRQREHHAAVVDTYITLLLAGARSRRLQVVEVMLDWEIRQALQHKGAHIQVPDLVLVLENTAGARAAWAIEVDRGTVSPNAMATRLLDYATAHQAGRPLRGVASWSVLLVCPSQRRRNRLALRCYEEADLPLDFIHYAVDETLTERAVFTAAPWWAITEGPQGTARLTPAHPFAALLVARPEGRPDTYPDCQDTLEAPESGFEQIFQEAAARGYPPAHPAEGS